MALKFQRWKLSGELSPNQYDDNSCIITITGLPSGWSWELFLNHGEYLDVIALDLDESGTSAQTILKKEQLGFSGLYTIQLRGKKDEITQHTNKLGFTVGDSFSEAAHWPEIPDAFNKYVQSVADNLKESLEGNIDVSTAVEKYLEENPVTVTESDPTVSAWAKKKDPPTYSASEVGAVPAPSAAKVGQTIVVSAVDDTGAPTAWEAADLPTGGGGETWRLVQDITLDTDDIGTLEFTTDSDGNAFNLKKFALIGKAKASGSASCYITINGKAFLSTQTSYQTFNFRPFQLQGDFNKGFLTLQLVGANNTAVNGVFMYTHIRTGDFASSALEKIEGSGLTQFKISPQSATVTFLTGSHFELWGVDA